VQRLRVPLIFSSPPLIGALSEDPCLDYTLSRYRSPNGKNQARLDGRLLLTPDIDLNNYRTRAVLDWLELGFETKVSNQATWIQRNLKYFLHARGISSSLYVSGRERNRKRYQGTEFIVRVQDPRPRTVALLIDEIRRRYDILQPDEPTKLWGIEVSVDFYVTPGPNGFGDRETLLRWRMVEALRKHVAHLRALETLEGGTPRYTVGTSNGKTRTALIVNAQKGSAGTRNKVRVARFGVPEIDHRHFSIGNYNQAPIDSTVYLGGKNTPILCRIMDKTTDRKNPETNDRIALPPARHRARFEVSFMIVPGYERDILNILNLGTFNDLASFDFRTLRRTFYGFFHPTFSQSLTASDVLSGKTDFEQSVFELAGMTGLHPLQAEAARAQSRLHATRRLPSPSRTLGGNGFMVAYSELNQKVDRALDGLSRTWSRMPVRTPLGRSAA
jgi:hypothetical protein